MPEYIIKNESVSKYFRIDADTSQASIVSMGEATGFGNKALAARALRDSAALRIAQAKPGSPVPKWATAAMGWLMASWRGVSRSWRVPPLVIWSACSTSFSCVLPADGCVGRT